MITALHVIPDFENFSGKPSDEADEVCRCENCISCQFSARFCVIKRDQMNLLRFLATLRNTADQID